jgi:C-terminal peptidase prc
MLKLNKRVSALLLAVALLIGSIVTLAADNAVALTILHTNDVHGAFERSETAIGHDVIAAVYDDYAADGTTILLDAGDASQGVYFVGQSRGEAAVDIMNAVGYDALTVGNHEFDYGWERLKELAALANFPFLLKDSLSGGAENFAAYTVIERGGLRVGVFGITTPETGSKTVGGIELADNGQSFGTIDVIIDDANRAVAALRMGENVDIVVCLSHLGVEDAGFGTSYDIRDNVSGIDVIIDGHSHTKLADIEQIPGKPPITSTGNAAVALGKVTFTKTADGYAVNVETIAKTEVENYTPKAEVTAVIEKWSALVEVAGSEIVATLKQEIPLTRSILRTSEAVAGNLVTDAMRAASGADIALENGGGVRDTLGILPAGDLTRSQIISVLPFGNVLQMAEVSGETVKAVLENGVALYPEASGGFPQVSGVDFAFDPSAPVGERVLYVNVGGEPLVLEKLYKFATNDFTGTLGGDGYDMLRKPFAERPLPIAHSELATLDEVVVWYLNEHADDVKYETDGRIFAIETFADLSFEQNLAIVEILQSEIFVGFEDGLFHPDEPLTKAQLATLFVRLFELDENVNNGAPLDAVGTWYEAADAVCVDEDYLKPDADGTFNGDKILTYAEFCGIFTDLGIIFEIDDALLSEPITRYAAALMFAQDGTDYTAMLSQIDALIINWGLDYADEKPGYCLETALANLGIAQPNEEEMQENPELFYTIANAMLALTDKWAYFSSIENYDGHYQDSPSGADVGFGVLLRTAGLYGESYNGLNGAMVREVYPNSAAEKAGVQVGDVFYQLNDVNVSLSTIREIIDCGIRVKDKYFDLTLIRGDEEIILPITASNNYISAVKYEKRSDTAILQFNDFSLHTLLEDFRESYTKALESENIIIDLRSNGGGYLPFCVAILDMIVPEKDVLLVTAQGNENLGDENYFSTGGGQLPKGKLIILTNELTGSAAEILAGTLQELGLAEIVGTTTVGKGVAQQAFVETIPNHILALTTARIILPNDKIYNKIGIIPDHYVSDSRYQFADGEMLPLTTLHIDETSTQSDIKALQQRLNLLGYFAVTQNGVYDKVTQWAVRSYAKMTGVAPEFAVQKIIEHCAKMENNKLIQDIELPLSVAFELIAREK